MNEPTDVPTLRGPISREALGFTLMHEHIFVRSTETTQNYSQTWGSDDERVVAAAATLQEAKGAGVETIVDLTVLGLGRDIELMGRVASATDVNIVAATGAYVLDRLPYHFRFNPPMRDGDMAKGLAAWFTADITDGIAGTDMRAGVIKCATDVDGLTDDVVTVLQAAAYAANETGALIMTHADAETRRGIEQRDIFQRLGVDLTRVVIGHVGDSQDLDYARRLMDSGMSIGMDRFGLGLPTPQRVATIAILCSEGYADRMVLSHDAACHSEWLDASADGMADWNFRHIPDVVVPALAAAGVTDADIDALVRRNPARLLPVKGSPA